jgi:hypothetical protein
MTEVKYVIELNAGITAKLGIRPGDKVDECDDRDESGRALQPCSCASETIGRDAA